MNISLEEITGAMAKCEFVSWKTIVALSHWAYEIALYFSLQMNSVSVTSGSYALLPLFNYFLKKLEKLI